MPLEHTRTVQACMSTSDFFSVATHLARKEWGDIIVMTDWGTTDVRSYSGFDSVISSGHTLYLANVYSALEFRWFFLYPEDHRLRLPAVTVKPVGEHTFEIKYSERANELVNQLVCEPWLIPQGRAG